MRCFSNLISKCMTSMSLVKESLILLQCFEMAFMARNGNTEKSQVVMVPTFALMVTLDIVIITSSEAAIGDKCASWQFLIFSDIPLRKMIVLSSVVFKQYSCIYQYLWRGFPAQSTLLIKPIVAGGIACLRAVLLLMIVVGSHMESR